MTTTEELLADMRADLVAAVAASNAKRARHRKVLLTVPAVAALTGAVVGGVLWPGDGDVAYAFTTEPSGTIRVEIYPDFDDVGRLEADLEAAGLRAEVIQLRGHPALDGLVEVASHQNQGTAAMTFDGGEFVLDPQLFDGPVEILVYSAAEDGQPYQFAPSVFSPGQPLGGLSCAFPDRPLAVDEFERRAREAGYDQFEWFTTSENGRGIEPSERRPQGNVVDASEASPRRLRVFVGDIDRPAQEVILLSDGTHYRESATCSPELAARWQ